MVVVLVVLILRCLAKSDPAPSFLSEWGWDHYLDNPARSRLYASLWLAYGLALARGLAKEDGGMDNLGANQQEVLLIQRVLSAQLSTN